jgi:hypothetical protein
MSMNRESGHPSFLPIEHETAKVSPVSEAFWLSILLDLEKVGERCKTENGWWQLESGFIVERHPT